MLVTEAGFTDDSIFKRETSDSASELVVRLRCKFVLVRLTDCRAGKMRTKKLKCKKVFGRRVRSSYSNIEKTRPQLYYALMSCRLPQKLLTFQRMTNFRIDFQKYEGRQKRRQLPPRLSHSGVRSLLA